MDHHGLLLAPGHHYPGGHDCVGPSDPPAIPRPARWRRQLRPPEVHGQNAHVVALIALVAGLQSHNETGSAFGRFIAKGQAEYCRPMAFLRPQLEIRLHPQVGIELVATPG